MKSPTPYLILIIALIAGIIVGNQSSQASLSINQPAPDFTATDINGNKINLSGLEGKYVILEWTNHECPFVKKHYDSNNMQALQKKYTKQNVVWISIISSAPGKQGHINTEQAQQLTTERNANPTHIILDEAGEIGKLYQAKTTPHMYIITPESNLAYMGAIDSVNSANPADIKNSTNYVDQAFTELSEGKAVSVPSTRAYGCSVKY